MVFPLQFLKVMDNTNTQFKRIELTGVSLPKVMTLVFLFLAFAGVSQEAAAQNPPLPVKYRAVQIVKAFLAEKGEPYNYDLLDKRLDAIKTEIQLEALETTLQIKSISVSAEIDACAKFATQIQIEALKIVAPIRRSQITYDYKFILQFQTELQVEALRITAIPDGSPVFNNYSDLLAYTEPEQLEVLKYFAQRSNINKLVSSLAKIAEFKDPGLMRLFRIKSAEGDLDLDQLNKLLHEYTESYSEEYAREIPHSFAKVEEYLKAFGAPKEKWHYNGFQLFIKNNVEEMTLADVSYSPAQISAIANETGIPANELLSPAKTARDRNRVKTEFSKIKTGSDLLASPLWQLDFTIDRPLGIELLTYLTEHSEWFLQLPIDDTDLPKILSNRIFEISDGALYGNKLKNDLVKARLQRTTGFREFLRVVRSVGGYYGNFIHTMFPHFLELPMTFDELCIFLGEFTPQLATDENVALVKKALLDAPSLELMYKIPITQLQMQQLGLMGLYRQRQDQMGETWYNRTIGYPTQKRLRDICQLRMDF